MVLRMGRFKKLVESKEAMEKFVANYKIPNNVGLRYCKEGDWHIMRREGEVVIPIIDFLEGGMRLPMRLVVRDYLRHFRLAPVQCAVNVFRILGSVNALNEQMGLKLTHHDVNWCYNLQYLKGKSYYMKARDERVRLILCLPESSQGLTKTSSSCQGRGTMAYPARLRRGRQVEHLSRGGSFL